MIKSLIIMVSKQFFKIPFTHYYNNINYEIDIYFLKNNNYIIATSFNELINLFQEKKFLVRLIGYNTLIFSHIDLLDNKDLSFYETFNNFISPDIYNFDDLLVYLHHLLLEI